MSSGWRAARSSRRPSVAMAGRTPSTSFEKLARACRTSKPVAASTVRCTSSSAAAQGVGQRQQDAMDFLRLLLLERDDLVVDLDRAQRLEEQARAAARAAVHDAGDRRPMLGADDEHVAAVAVGDDLLLQILRRVLAAQIGLERAAQPGPLLAQALTDAAKLRARVVDDVAAGIDLPADVGDLRLEGRRVPRQSRGAPGKRRARAVPRRTSPRSRRGSPPASAAGGDRAHAPRPTARSAWSSRSSGARSPIGLSARKRTVSAVASSAVGDLARLDRAARGAPASPGPEGSARSGRPLRRCDRIREP